VDAVQSSKANKAHFLVAELERLGFIKAVITQNIDGLHKRLAARMCTKSMATLRQLLVCDAIRNTLWKKLGSNSTTVTYLNAAAEDYCVQCGSFRRSMPDTFFQAVREVESSDLMIVMEVVLRCIP